MKLQTALRLTEGDIVAFVGGGGKTTAMFRLADEIVAAGGRVITTTTTRIFAAQVELAPAHFSARDVNRARVEAALDRHQHVLLTGPVDRVVGKAAGVSPELVEELQAIPDLTAILIEADGSRMRPFKAPADHEPVIPDVTTHVVPVVGAEVLGQPLDDVHVHRPERVARLSEARQGDPVTPELVARVLCHPEGGLKGIPPGARVVPLVNKVDSPATDLGQARALADLLLRSMAVNSVLLGAVKRYKHPVMEVHGRVAGVVLAAGRSTRMGQAKQVLPWGSTTLVGAVVRQLRAAGLAEIVVVTGAARAEVERALADESGVRLVHNPDYESGEMSVSLQVALRSLPGGCAAALVALVDQPQLEPEVVRAVIQRWRESLALVVAPVHDGRRGHPLLFDRAAWPGVLALPPEANPREALQRVPVEAVAVDTDSVLRDIDTPEDYTRERQRGQ